MSELPDTDLCSRRLVRSLALSVLHAEGGNLLQDEERKRLLAQLEDTAHSTLLGLHAEAEPVYIPPDERQARAAAGVAAAAAALRQESYPSLAADLEAAAARLKSLHAVPLLGSLTEAETGAPLVLPLREHDALLAFLLALRGSRPSIRQRIFTFQQGPLGGSPPQPAEAAAAGAVPTPDVREAHRQGGAAAAGSHVPLSSGVFGEAPNPNALTDGCAPVVALLPGQLGLPTGAFAGLDDLQALGAGLSSRPVWAPTAAAALPRPRAASWLPLPPALQHLAGDERRGAPPGALGLPLSLLSMADEPGSCTVFGPEAAAWDGASAEGDAASADSVQPQQPGRVAAAGERQLGLSCPLWSLQEAELARHALLALQGVASSLRHLQALLAAPAALPRRSAAGLLRRLAEAGELRQRLQRFAAAFSGGGGGSGSGGRPDPVQQAFATAAAEVLQRQSAALQQLEQQEGEAWVQTVAVGGTQGQRVAARGPSLLQVALHTGRLQLQLRSLADLCWCLPSEAEAPLSPAAAQGGADGAQQPGDGSGGGSSGACLWQEGGFPGGVQLLELLYRRASEADDTDGPMLRFLFVQAMQPYLRHLHSWAFTTHAVGPEFGAAGDKQLLTLEFAPPPAAGAQGRDAPPEPLVPADLPAFLQPLHAALMRSGAQLRLLHSLGQQGRQLAQQLCDIGEREVRQRQAQGSGSGSQAGLPAPGAWHTVTSFAARPEDALAAAGGSAPAATADEEGPWLALAGSAAADEASAGVGGALGCQDLQLSSEGLQQAVALSQDCDSARAEAVSGWLGAMALGRRLAEHAAVTEQLGRAASQRERQAEAATRQAATLSRRASAKSQLLAEQQATLAERRVQRAAAQAQQEAADRQVQAQAALRQHSAAVAELEAALARSTSLPGQPAAAAAAAGTAAQDAPVQGQPAAAPASTTQAPELPPAKAAGSRRDSRPDQNEQRQQQRAPAGYRAPAAAAPSRPPLVPPAGGLRSAGGSGAFDWPTLQTSRSAGPGAAALMAATAAAAAAAAAPAGSEGEAGSEPADALAPLPAVLEACVTQGVLSQYRATSRACVRLFLDELRVLEHLEALRRYFFQGAGDWADALVGRLGAHADSLEPLAGHRADALLADAARGTTAEDDPYAAHLRIQLLPDSATAITAQEGALASRTPQRTPQRGRSSYWASRTAVQLAPTQVDCLDAVGLQYHVGWPLSAVVTEDTLAGYAAVFSMMARVRRAEQLLRGARAPLAVQPRSTADLLLSEEDADLAHRRMQRLRAFHHGGLLFVAAVQAFLHARTTGDAWVQLLAKLMVSSEEVAASVLSRQPSAAMSGLLSRMNSLGPTGKAAARLAQHMSRAALSASGTSSPTGAGAGASAGQLGRFSSLLSAVSAASSAAPSGTNTPRGGAAGASRPLSRFASQNLQGGGPAAAAASSRRQAGEASAGGSPSAAATAGDGMSRQTSLTSVLLAQAAAEVGGAASGSGAAAGAGPELDAAAWIAHLQQSQQGIADLQELLDLHRAYVRQAAEDCLTFGGSPAVQQAVEGALQCLLAFAFALQGAVRAGAPTRASASSREACWAQALRLDAPWRPLADATSEFEGRMAALRGLLAPAGSAGPLAELALQLDFNGFWAASERRQATAAARRASSGASAAAARDV